MAAKRFDQAALSEFFSRVVERLGRSVGVEEECVSREELAFFERAIPILKESQHSGRRLESLQSVIAPQEKGRKIPTIRIIPRMGSSPLPFGIDRSLLRLDGQEGCEWAPGWKWTGDSNRRSCKSLDALS
jgi:hypothetical protein